MEGLSVPGLRRVRLLPVFLEVCDGRTSGHVLLPGSSSHEEGQALLDHMGSECVGAPQRNKVLSPEITGILEG